MGKINNLPPNRPVNGDIIVGNFVIANANDDGVFTSLTDKQIDKYTEHFSLNNDKFKQSVDKAISNYDTDSLKIKNEEIDR